jgi:hypothetical protein
MKPDFGSRFRERHSQPANPSGAGKTLGLFQVAYWDMGTGQLVGTEFPGNIPYQSNLTYPKIELTWDQNNPGPPFRSGGPFTNLKLTDPSFQPQSVGHRTTCPEHRSSSGSNWRGFDYNGNVDCPTFLGLAGAPVNPDGSLPSAWVDSRFVTNLSGLGPQAYAKTMPRMSEAGVAQFLAEMRDTPRMLKQTGRFFHDLWKVDKGWRDLRNIIDPHAKYEPFKDPKRVSEDFLNYQFGWKPFVSDIQKMLNAYDRSEEFMLQRIKHNDRWLKRTADLGTEDTRTVYSTQANAASYQPYGENWNQMMRASLSGTGFSGARSVTTVYVNMLKHTWASGLFKYYRPEFDTSLADYASGLNALRRNLTLYGANINPSVLYKITPWTWLADWFSNVGSNIDNFNAQLNDGVASKYFYIMCHTSEVHEQETVFNFWDGAKTVKWFRSVETKQRVDGSPYGLGWSSNDLTARQFAILAALGISRKP